MTPRALLALSARFLALLLASEAVWYWLVPFYAGILVGVGNGFFTSFGYPPMLSLHDREIVLSVLSQNVQVTTGIMNFYGVPLLLALIWAVPTLSPTTRRRMSCAGLGSIAFLHWMNLLSQAGMLLAPTAFWKLFSEQLFLMSALGDMLLPAAFVVGLALRSRQGALLPQEARP